MQSMQSTYANRVRISNRFQRRSTTAHSSIKPFTREFSNSLPGRYKRDADISTLKPHCKEIRSFPLANRTMNYQKNILENNISIILNNITLLSGKFKSNLTNEKQNLPRDLDATLLLNVKPQNRNTAKDDTSCCGTSALRLGRNQRNVKERKNRKNKKHRRNKKRNNRNRSGIFFHKFQFICFVVLKFFIFAYILS